MQAGYVGLIILSIIVFGTAYETARLRSASSLVKDIKSPKNFPGGVLTGIDSNIPLLKVDKQVAVYAHVIFITPEVLNQIRDACKGK